jgi:hypothetical protein
MLNGNASCGEISTLVRRCLREGKSVEIDGLGSFVPDGRSFRFEPSIRPRVFLAYVQEDSELLDRLYNDLTNRGFDPWMDRRKLLPGQNWPRAIDESIECADFFLACFSERSVRKPGGFQAEIRYALDCARRKPLDEVFLIPVRLDDCRVPAKIQREIQYVDLFPEWQTGIERLTRVLRKNASREKCSFAFIRG